MSLDVMTEKSSISPTGEREKRPIHSFIHTYLHLLVFLFFFPSFDFPVLREPAKNKSPLSRFQMHGCIHELDSNGTKRHDFYFGGHVCFSHLWFFPFWNGVLLESRLFFFSFSSLSAPVCRKQGRGFFM